MRVQRHLAVLTATILLAAAAPAVELKPDIEAVIGRAQTWLLAQHQPTGAFVPGAQFTIGISALAVDSLCSGPLAVPGDDPRIQATIAMLLSHQQADGGIYLPEEGLGNYNTSITLMAIAAADCVSAHAEQVQRMQQYLFGLQNQDAGSINEGGIGYGSRGKGHEDLSNTTMAVAGLRASGVPADHPNLQKAMAFLQRCQNLSGHNQLPWVTNDGGAVYSPDESKAGGSWTVESGEQTSLSSYGSMTYALISSYITLDLKPGDPRVDAALAWVRQHYRFDANPGMAADKEQEGLFYYYMMMAKTFDLLDQGPMELQDGRAVDWRRDLFEAIRSRAVPVTLDDGTEASIWMNSAPRWGEGVPHLSTAYMVRALKRIHASL